MIRPKDSGFNEWETLPEYSNTDQGFDNPDDILESYQEEFEVFELGVDHLPKDCNNILGRIHNQPERVFAFKCEGHDWEYFGIMKGTK